MSQRGFTLVELVMTLVLISVLAIAAVPRFFSSTGFKQQAFFQDTLNAARYAQKLAVSSGCQTQIQFSGNSYTVIRENNCGSGLFSSSLPVAHPVNQTQSFSNTQDGATISATNSTTTFTMLGEADANNIVSIGTKQFTIVADTGFIYDSTP
jgi:MSHA pilin protein MshC